MKTIEEYRNIIEQELQSIQYPGGNLKFLYEPIKYALSAGGKRIRPVLTVKIGRAHV